MGKLSHKRITKSNRLKSKKSKRQYGGKRLSKIRRKKIQRVKISRKRVKRGGSVGPGRPRVTQIPVQIPAQIPIGPTEDPRTFETNWDYEENPADGACFYWAGLRGLNRLAAKGKYTYEKQSPGKGYLGETLSTREDKLLGGPLGFFPDNQFGRDYLSPEIKEYNILRLRNEFEGLAENCGIKKENKQLI